jgi:phospholipid/cholesterol/gamma-HCH transport system substrate-binding protein
MASFEKSAMGAFVIGGFVLFAVGLFLIGDRRLLFSDSGEYYSEFAQVSSLEVGAMVRVAGMNAGEVLEVQVPTAPEGKFRVKFSIVEKLHPIVRSDSVASLQTDGLLGNKYLLVSSGTSLSGTAPAGSTIPSREPFEISDLLNQIRQTVGAIDMTVGQVKGDVTDATQTVAETAKHVDQIIVAAQDDVKRITQAASLITENAGVIIAGVKSGNGTVGKLFNDDSIYNSMVSSTAEIHAALKNIRQTSSDIQQLVARFESGEIPGNVEETIQNVRDSSERLKAMVSSLQPTLASGEGITTDLRATLSSAREAMSDLAEDTEALKRSFFFRGFFKDRGFYDLDRLSLAEYESKEFNKDFKKERAWIQQVDLFTVRPDASEELSDRGKQKVDTAMADFLGSIRDNALIVEGYAGSGTSDEQFRRSLERAVKVREYLLKRFSLSAEYVGVMPMGTVRLNSPAGAVQDGVALVLLKK